MLHILRNLICTYISNCYIISAKCFVIGGCEILSKEGTTQAFVPRILSLLHFLLNFILPVELQTEEVAFSDDLAVRRKLENKKFWG